MVEDDMIFQRVGDTQIEDASVNILFDKRYPRNIWVEKRQAVYVLPQIVRTVQKRALVGNIEF